MKAEAYDQYAETKQWHAEDFARPTPVEARLYAAEVGQILGPRVADAGVLEIGFGNGHFLGWAMGRTRTLYGMELQEELVRRARTLGVKVVARPDEIAPGSLDLVVALDVFEHVPLDELRILLAAIHRVLRPGGALLARFPNGDSPISLPLTYGDPTHVTVLGAGIVNDLMRRGGWRTHRLRAPLEPSTGLREHGRRAAKRMLRRLHATFMRLAYYGGDIPSTFTMNYMLVATK